MTNVPPKPVDWDPRKEPDKLAALAQVTTAMLHGRPALDHRLDELGAGCRGRSEGVRGEAELTQAEAAAERVLAGESQEDVAERERREFERELTSSLDAACRAWERYKRVVEPRDGVAKLAEPGCELCAKVPNHWCPVYGFKVVMTEPVTKRDRPKFHTLWLCEWCLTRTWPSRMGRLPTNDEVTAHAEGRRVNWRGGNEPRMVEVPCPECRDENRKARRACLTCSHVGKVLKTVSV